MARPPSPMVVVRHGRHTNSVVVCHDGSENACAATHALSLMPWVSELIITVVAVKDGRADIDGGIESSTRSLVRAGAKVHHRILRGEPVDELLRYLHEHQGDLVVPGTTGLRVCNVSCSTHQPMSWCTPPSTPSYLPAKCPR